MYAVPSRIGILTAAGPFAIVESDVDEKIKQLLRELGTAINESISGSDDVNKQIQRIRDEGYNLYVVLDATIGLNRQDEPEQPTEVIVKSDKEVQFRININDLTHALKPVVLPGEKMNVRLMKGGEEPGQGVGYLDDGTMVVVEQGRGHINEEVEFTVTSALQTSAGRMIFGRMGDGVATASGGPPAPRRQRPHHEAQS